MPRRSPADPHVATFSDHQVITPPNRLKDALRPNAPGLDDPVARAEAALASLAGEFAAWMAAECERLRRAHDALLTTGETPASCHNLFRAAHDLRGGAAQFGSPHIAALAESLCCLIEQTSPQDMPLALVAHHVHAVHAILRESGTMARDAVAEQLVARLRELTDGHLRGERVAMNDLPMIDAPRLAP